MQDLVIYVSSCPFAIKDIYFPGPGSCYEGAEVAGMDHLLLSGSVVHVQLAVSLSNGLGGSTLPPPVDNNPSWGFHNPPVQAGRTDCSSSGEWSWNCLPIPLGRAGQQGSLAGETVRATQGGHPSWGWWLDGDGAQISDAASPLAADSWGAAVCLCFPCYSWRAVTGNMLKTPRANWERARLGCEHGGGRERKAEWERGAKCLFYSVGCVQDTNRNADWMLRPAWQGLVVWDDPASVLRVTTTVWPGAELGTCMGKEGAGPLAGVITGQCGPDLARLAYNAHILGQGFVWHLKLCFVSPEVQEGLCHTSQVVLPCRSFSQHCCMFLFLAATWQELSWATKRQGNVWGACVATGRPWFLCSGHSLGEAPLLLKLVWLLKLLPSYNVES